MKLSISSRMIIVIMLSLGSMMLHASEDKERKEALLQAGGYLNYFWEWSGPHKPPAPQNYAPYFTRVRALGIEGVSSRFPFFETAKNKPWTAPQQYDLPHFIMTVVSTEGRYFQENARRRTHFRFQHGNHTSHTGTSLEKHRQGSMYRLSLFRRSRGLIGNNMRG